MSADVMNRIAPVLARMPRADFDALLAEIAVLILKSRREALEEAATICDEAGRGFLYESSDVCEALAEQIRERASPEAP